MITEPAGLRIWWDRPSQFTQRDQAAALSRLSDHERGRWSSFRRQEDQDRYLTSWTLVRKALAELTGSPAEQLRFDRGCLHCGHPDHGKPRLLDPANSGWHFSLSHSGDRVLLAAGRSGEIGADVEAITDRINDIGRMVLHPSEAQASGADLLRIWVRKEAVLKATGHGLGVSMTKFAVSPAGAPGRLLSWPGEADLPQRLELLDLPADAGYLAAIAVIRPAQ